MSVWLTVRSFIAFYLVVFGLAFVCGVSDLRGLLGALFVALGLTFFWRVWVASRTGE